MTPRSSVLLVGGGSGGHIYPNLAVVERLRDMDVDVTPHLVVSQRPLDAQIAEASGVGFTAIPAAPLSVRPRAGLKFLREYRRGQTEVARLIRETNAAAMIATGGFVSGPAVAAAKRAAPGRLPVALVSLDAVPGRANRWSAKKVTAVFSAFETHAEAKPLPGKIAGQLPGQLPGAGAEVIGFPLRQAAVAPPDVSTARARAHFGLDAERKTLLVFAGSQGARTINQAMIELMDDWQQQAESGWQLLHIAGPENGLAESIQRGYGDHGIAAQVLPFCDRMDLAWRAADVALTRCGAGTVAEAWANAVPSVMLPYPFHKDEHQKHNAAPLVRLGGAVVVKDQIDAPRNAAQLREVFASILEDDAKQDVMRQAMLDHPPRDGAQRLADWVKARVLG
ncbi:MAG: UDP-N-acetylglucosamine--N-acetylmuramyl-(pentapeptide) pyrophosphoryl-undecaprenol N-acetylglucosamine transferase [Planctomycetota bacterium]